MRPRNLAVGSFLLTSVGLVWWAWWRQWPHDVTPRWDPAPHREPRAYLVPDPSQWRRDVEMRDGVVYYWGTDEPVNLWTPELRAAWEERQRGLSEVKVVDRTENHATRQHTITIEAPAGTVLRVESVDGTVAERRFTASRAETVAVGPPPWKITTTETMP